MSATWQHYRARVAALSRDHDDAEPVMIEARQNLAVARLEQHAHDLVAAFPPLTDDQVASVVAILRTSGGGAPPSSRGRKRSTA